MKVLASCLLPLHLPLVTQQIGILTSRSLVQKAKMCAVDATYKQVISCTDHIQVPMV